MFANVVAALFTFLVFLSGSQIHAGTHLPGRPAHPRHPDPDRLFVSPAPALPIAARQIGNLQCNIDRLSIVGDLAGLQNTLSGMASAAGMCVLHPTLPFSPRCD